MEIFGTFRLMANRTYGFHDDETAFRFLD